MEAGGADDRGSLTQWGDGGGSGGGRMWETLGVDFAVPLQQGATGSQVQLQTEKFSYCNEQRLTCRLTLLAYEV